MPFYSQSVYRNQQFLGMYVIKFDPSQSKIKFPRQGNKTQWLRYYYNKTAYTPDTIVRISCIGNTVNCVSPFWHLPLDVKGLIVCEAFRLKGNFTDGGNEFLKSTYLLMEGRFI